MPAPFKSQHYQAIIDFIYHMASLSHENIDQTTLLAQLENPIFLRQLVDTWGARMTFSSSQEEKKFHALAIALLDYFDACNQPRSWSVVRREIYQHRSFLPGALSAVALLLLVGAIFMLRSYSRLSDELWPLPPHPTQTNCQQGLDYCDNQCQLNYGDPDNKSEQELLNECLRGCHSDFQGCNNQNQLLMEIYKQELANVTHYNRPTVTTRRGLLGGGITAVILSAMLLLAQACASLDLFCASLLTVGIFSIVRAIYNIYKAVSTDYLERPATELPPAQVAGLITAFEQLHPPHRNEHTQLLSSLAYFGIEEPEQFPLSRLLSILILSVITLQNPPSADGKAQTAIFQLLSQAWTTLLTEREACLAPPREDNDILISMDESSLLMSAPVAKDADKVVKIMTNIGIFQERYTVRSTAASSEPAYTAEDTLGI